MWTRRIIEKEELPRGRIQRLEKSMDKGDPPGSRVKANSRILPDLEVRET